MGRDAVPAGVARTHTPGRPPGSRSGVLRLRAGPAAVERESGTIPRGAPQGAGALSHNAPGPARNRVARPQKPGRSGAIRAKRLVGAPFPSWRGTEKTETTGEPSRPHHNRGQRSCGFGDPMVAGPGASRILTNWRRGIPPRNGDMVPDTRPWGAGPRANRRGIG